jgi:hypothetical protein
MIVKAKELALDLSRLRYYLGLQGPSFETLEYKW